MKKQTTRVWIAALKLINSFSYRGVKCVLFYCSSNKIRRRAIILNNMKTPPRPKYSAAVPISYFMAITKRHIIIIIKMSRTQQNEIEAYAPPAM